MKRGLSQGLGGALALVASLAMGADAVGRLPGSFGISPGGQASYEIPIKVPAGTNGVAPKLALRYSSTPSNGLAGVGWGLSGASSITRCSHSKVLDGTYDLDVTLASSDKLCLDGQRLLSGGKAANPTANGWLDRATIYTSPIADYKKIEATLDATSHQPQQFRVTTKDGQVLVYGATADFRVVAAPKYDNVSLQYIPTDQVLSWLLSSVTDRNGNTISYSYVIDAATSSAVLDHITYTANQSISPAIAAQHVVNFDYTQNASVAASYVAGSRVLNSKMLATVRISSGDVANGNVSEVRRYTLSYRQLSSRLTRRPLLNSVQECDTYQGSQKCLPATTFEWSDGELDFNRAITGPAWSDTPNTTSTSWNCGSSGVNGYCTSGVTIAGTANTWNGDASYYTTVRYGDIDGDGKADICGRISTGMQCFRSLGNGFSATPITISAWSNAASWNQEKFYSTIQFADVNGDGKADLCARTNTGIECYLGFDENGFSATVVKLTTDFTDGLGWGDATKKYYYTLRFVDLDQDGRSDICGIGPSGLRCYYARSDANGQPTFTPASMYVTAANIPPAGLSAWSSTTIDFTRMVPTLMTMNLNRSRDLALCARGLTVGGSSANGHMMCIVPLTASGASAQMFDVDLSKGASFDWRTSRFTELNGDGWPDLCFGSVQSYACMKNNGIAGPAGQQNFGGLIGAVSVQGQVYGNYLSKELYDQSTGFVWLNVQMNNNNSSAPAGSLENIYYQIAKAAAGEPNYATLRYVDIDGDGKADVCERAADGFHCRLQRRMASNSVCSRYKMAFAANQTDVCAQSEVNKNPMFSSSDGYMDIFANRLDLPVAWADWAIPHKWNLPQYYLSIEVVDVTGDGLLDVCGRGKDGITCYAGSSSPRDLVSTITDGFGNKTLISYDTLTNATVYTKGSGAIYPNIDLQPAAVVAAAVKSSNGIGGFNQVSYHYNGLVSNVEYGAQGFASVEVRDEATGKLTHTYYKQAYPFSGAVAATYQKYCPTTVTASADCFIMGKNQATWQQAEVLPSPYTATLPYTKSAIEDVFELPTGASIGSGGVLALSSQTSLSASVSTVVAGGAVDLVAQVTTGAPSGATGTITFLNGNSVLGTVALSSGTATFTASFATAGAKALRAVYSGDSNSGSSTSPYVNVLVNQASASVTLQASPSPVLSGQSMTLLAVVSGSSPSGAVTFKDGAVTLGTITLANGQAQMTTSWAIAGSHSLSAVYEGDSNNSSQVSSIVTVTVVDQMPTTVALTATYTATSVGALDTLTATVSGAAPSGAVTFKDGNVILGTASLNVSGVASLPVRFETGGVHPVSATYAGNATNAAGTSSVLNINATPANPNINLSFSPIYGGVSQAVVLMATISVNGLASNSSAISGSVTFKEGATVLGTGTVTNGAAQISKTWTTAGAKTLSFEYSGNANVNALTSTGTYTVLSAKPTVALAVSPTTVLAGQSATLTATLSGGSSPTGTVSFYNNTTLLGTVSLSSLTATLSKVISSTSGEVLNLKATYNGNSTNASNSSTVVSKTVAKSNPTLTLSGSNSVEVGKSVTIVAILSASTATPTGLVTLKNGTTVLGTADLNGATSVSFPVTFAAPASISLTASYAGDANNTTKTTATGFALAVTKRTTTITNIYTPATEAGINQPVTIQATLGNTTAQPGGTLTLLNGTTTLATAPAYNTATGQAKATFTQTFTTAGAKTLKASYNGDTLNATSSSAVLSYVIKAKAPTLTLTSDKSSAFFGQNVVFTAQLGGGQSPTGSITFKSSGSSIGAATIDATGKAVLTKSFSAGSTQSLTAEYAGDTNNTAAVSAAVALSLSKAATATITLTAGPQPVRANQAVALTAQVTGLNPTNYVTFKEGVTTLGSVALDASGKAVLNKMFMAGSHSVTASYFGDINNTNADSVPVIFVVDKAQTTAGMTFSANPVVTGSQVTATIQVIGAAPTGKLTATDNGTYVGEILFDASSTYTSTSATTTVTQSFYGAGTHNYVLTYVGDANNESSISPTVALVVKPVAVSLNLQATPSPASAGQLVTLSCGVIGGQNPSGNIAFLSGNTVIGYAPIQSVGGSTFATFKTTFNVGAQSLTASYAGDGNSLNNSATSAAVSLTVTKVLPQIALSLSQPSPTVGQSVTLTAAVSGATPGGSIVFKDGNTVLNATAVSLVSGIATYDVTFTTAGAHSITATYSGDANNAATSSDILPVNVADFVGYYLQKYLEEVRQVLAQVIQHGAATKVAVVAAA